MSVAVWFAVVFLAVLAIWFIWNALRLPGSFFWNAARRARDERERLARMVTEQLVDEVRRRIELQRWERLPSASEILSNEEWTDATLLRRLHSLRVEAAKEQPGQSGPGSNVFEFYDCGLASIVEILQTRTGSGAVE